jgi:thioredoxin reductase (NADPH)
METVLPPHPRVPKQDPEPIETDALIIGAGPVGLFQIFELGLLGIHAHVVDALPQAGGQCVELYPDKPIYDIPALPVCSGADLIERLHQQVRPFDPVFHLGQEVTDVVQEFDGHFFVRTSEPTTFHARTVIIAGGVGAFQPRRLRIAGADVLEGSAIHYKVSKPAAFHGKDIVVLGGGDSAIDWALALHDQANSLVLVHRSRDLRAAPASVKRMHELCNELKIQFLVGEASALHTKDGQLRAIDVRGTDLVTRRVSLDQLLVFFGLSPKLGPIARWGLALEKQQLAVSAETFQTSIKGIFAVGDINSYPGKKKLILSGFHEAALASFAAFAHLHPKKKISLQYTTTSPGLHRRLGLKVA